MKPSRNVPRGSVLLVVVACVSVAALSAIGYLIVANEHRERAARQIDQEAKEMALEQNLIFFKQEIEKQAKSNATGVIDLQIASEALASTDSQAGWQTRIATNRNVFRLNPFYQAAGLNSTAAWYLLAEPNDPFVNAKALVQDIKLRGQSPSAKDGPAQHNKQVLMKPHVSVREIPVSEFTVYSGGSALTLAAPAFSGDIGRVFARGAVTVNSDLQFSLPLLTQTSVQTGASGQLNFWSPDSALWFCFTGSTGASPSDDAKWDNQSATSFAGKIVTPDVLPLDPVVSPQLVGAADQLPLQVKMAMLKGSCALQVVAAPTQTSSAKVAGAGVRIVMHAAQRERNNPTQGTEQRAGEDKAFQAVPKNGSVVLAFDYARLTQPALISSLYLEVDTASGVIDPAGIILIRAASQLAGDLSIVSPNRVFVAGDFNDDVVPGVSKAASIITGQDLAGVNVNWGQDLFGPN